MDPLQTLVTALVAGATALQHTPVPPAIGQAYSALKSYLHDHYAALDADLAQLERQPASKGRRTVLEEGLAATNAAGDTALLQLAQALLAAIQRQDAAGTRIAGIDMSDVTAASIKLSDILAQGAGHVTGVAMNRVDVAGAIEISGVRAGNLTPLDAPKPATGAAPAAADPISILFLAANPLDMEPLRLDEECRAIDAALRQAEYRHFDLRPHWAVQVADLQELLLRRQPHILHFSGHGSDRNEIILQDASGQAAPVSAGALRTLFGLLKDNLRCVVLNACYTAEQAGAIADRIDCVVGMTEAISDPAARAFAVAFYRALGYGRTVQEAFDLGCSQIDLNNLDEADKPVLIAQHADPVTIRFVDPKA